MTTHRRLLAVAAVLGALAPVAAQAQPQAPAQAAAAATITTREHAVRVVSVVEGLEHPWGLAFPIEELRATLPQPAAEPKSAPRRAPLPADLPRREIRHRTFTFPSRQVRGSFVNLSHSPITVAARPTCRTRSAGIFR